MNSSPVRRPPPGWASWWLLSAGIYNLVWGAVVILFPHALFDVCNLPRMNYPEIWQCVGMIVGVYGIGYLVAAGDPRRHWPIVLVGLLGKIFGPIGFLKALSDGTFPPLFGLTILTNDLLWWIPFGLILRDAARAWEEENPLRFVMESRFAVPHETVFAFHESPGALSRLIPPWEKIEVVESSGSLAVGSRVLLRIWLGPIPLSLAHVHAEYDPPRLFADRQERGPFAYWYHRHWILDDGRGGTILRDEIDYRLPLGIVGRWLGGAFIRWKLKRMFNYRHEITRRAMEAASRAEV